VGWYGRDVIAFIFDMFDMIAFIFIDKIAAHCLPERSDKIKRPVLTVHALREALSPSEPL
jgi:hypothetical protein